MKAWQVSAIGEFEALIVFAQTAAKAKYKAKCIFFDEVPWVKLRCHHEKQADKYIKEGKDFLDWLLPEDRRILVSEFGYTCQDIFDGNADCASCCANDICEYRRGLI